MVPVMLIMDLSLCQSGTALTFPVLCLAAYSLIVSQIDGAVGCMRMRMTTITLRVKN